jgi:hypothetical protein
LKAVRPTSGDNKKLTGKDEVFNRIHFLERDVYMFHRKWPCDSDDSEGLFVKTFKLAILTGPSAFKLSTVYMLRIYYIQELLENLCYIPPCLQHAPGLP